MNKEVKVGSPPRMRGKVIGGFGVLVQIGITPACAGKSALCVNGGARSRDHPRMCGEKTAREFITYLIQGSPPRMRGRANGYPPVRSRPRDHPRVCGEEGLTFHQMLRPTGSPPRMRGRDLKYFMREASDGITPAYAGKSPPTWTPPCLRGDHPRVCGEELVCNHENQCEGGSPPRMRGRASSL